MIKRFLFLDRDGVINFCKQGAYILSAEEFRFLDGSLEAIALAKDYFERILVVTNQKCIYKGLLTHEKLAEIHSYMIAEIETAGGKIDKVYYCPDAEGINRKPDTGMALQAQRDFPEIVFEQSVMIGDSPGDIVFGKKMGMTTVFVATRTDIEKEELETTLSNSDFVCKSLLDGLHLIFKNFM